MGASVSIFTTAYKPKVDGPVKCMVLDSPYDELTEFIKRIAENQISVPSLVISAAILFIEKQIKTRTGVEISRINPADYVGNILVPSYWLIADKDE